MKLEKILAPLDGSQLAEQALQKAIEVAEPGAPTLLLLRAAEAVLRGTTAPILLLRAAGASVEQPTGLARKHDVETGR